MENDIDEETFEVPCKPFNLRLSHWDMRMMPVFSKRLLFFSLPNHDTARKKKVVGLLLAAFRSLVVQCPFLAGSIVVHPTVTWLRDIRQQGAARLEVRDYSDELKFTDLRKADFHPVLLDVEKLCPYPKPAYMQQEPVDVCCWRASFIEDGLIIAVTVAHTKCDGSGLSTILEAFATKLRQFQEGGTATHGADGEGGHQSVYSFDRTRVISGDGASGDIKRHPAWTTSPRNQHAKINNETAFAAYRIDIESLRRLK